MITTKLKSFLVLLAMMVGAVNSAWAGKTIGATDNSTDYEGASSDTYSLTPGDQIQFEFKNYTSKGKNWYNWLLFIYGATNDPFVLRADNCWFSGSNNSWDTPGNIPVTLTNSIDWSHYYDDLDGADVTINVVHSGSNISVNATAVNNGRTHTETLSLTPSDETATITTKLSVEYAHLEITKIKCTYNFASVANDRFTFGSDWMFYQSGLYNFGGGLRSFSIGNLYNGDEIKISYQKYNDGGSNNYNAATFTTANAKTSGGTEVSNSTVLESGSSYFMSSDGTLGLNFHRYVKITSIEITRTPEDTPALSFSSHSVNNQKVGGSFSEPTLSVTPSTATAHYSSSNISVASVDEFTGDVTLSNAGNVTITASLTVGNVTVTDSYDLTVISEKTNVYICDFTGCGGNYDLLTTTYQYDSNLKRISFNGQTYGSKTFQFNNFFALNNNVSTTIGYPAFFIVSDGIVYHAEAGSSIDLYLVSVLDGQSNPVGVHNGDKIKVWFADGAISASSQNLNTTNLVSGEEYVVTEDGDLILSLAAGVKISKIEIVHDWDTPSFIWSDANLTNKFDTSNGGKLLRYDLSTLNFIEPTAIVTPATASYTVKSLNQDVAKIGTDGDVMFVNTGWVNIQGTMKTGGNDLRDTYTVEVWANPGNYSESGNTCYMSDIGMLNSDRKTVTSIGGITLEFGSAEDATLIVEDPTGTTNFLVAYTINKLNGWRHKYPNCSLADPVVPTHGSFYKFTAQTNGAFSFKGIKNGGENTVVLVDASAMGTNLTTIAADSWGFVESETVDLTAGHTYYLYGNVPEDANSELGWSAFLLSEFTFNSTLRLLDNSNQEVSYGAISSNVEGSAEVLTIEGIANPRVDVVAHSSGITADFSVSNNKLIVSNISGDGGAIRLKISDGGTAVKYYTLTIPYRNGTHVWDFRTGTNGQSNTGIVSALKKNVDTLDLHLSGLARTYKVISKSGAGVWEHLIEPIIGVNGRVLGDNGFYFDKTAGLIFETRSLGLGAMETKVGYHTVTNNTNNAVTYYSDSSEIPDSVKNNNNYTIAEATSTVSGDNYPFDDESEYRLTYKATREASWLKMRGTSKIIFPGVKEGQYIKIYTYRHSDDKGETFYAENLVDLEAEPHTYDSQHTFKYHGVLNGSNSGGIERCEGAAIFKVPSNYSNANNILSQMPSVTLSDDGWANIYKIEVCDEYSTDMKMSLNRGVYPEFIDVEPDCEYSSIVIKDGTPVVQEYSGVCTQILVENAGTVNFYFEPLNGLTTDDYEVERFMDRTYNLVRVTYKSGHGVLKITQKEERGGYTIDKKEFYIAVNSLNSKTYPYTWDFTSHNMFQGNSSTETNLGNPETAGTPTSSGFDGYGKWTSTNGTYGVNFKTNVAMEDATTTKPLFAHGSELCAGSTPIVEMAGLGVAGAYTTKSISRTTGDNTYTYEWRTYDNTNNRISFDGNSLNFTDSAELTIPNVSNGMYIFLQASKNPNIHTNNEYSIPAGLAALWGNSDPFDIKAGVYLYQNTSGGTRDFTFRIPENTNISRIGVTDKVKSIGSTGYATESRDTIIDHTYQSELTNHPVKAYYIDTYNGSAYDYNSYPEVKKLGPITVVPERVGVVLYEDKVVENGNHGDFKSPLFVPAVNVTESSADAAYRGKNYMAPSVKWDGSKLAKDGVQFHSETTDSLWAVSGVHGEGKYTKFILTNTYLRYIKGKGDDPTEYHINTAAFYYLKTTGRTAEENTLAGNKAYLLIKNVPNALWETGGSSRSGMIFIDLEDMEVGDDATLVDKAVVDRAQQEDVFYTLSGMRVNGRPTARGIYICNGKKISVK